jgi:hypothetical protein
MTTEKEPKFDSKSMCITAFNTLVAEFIQYLKDEFKDYYKEMVITQSYVNSAIMWNKPLLSNLYIENTKEYFNEILKEDEKYLLKLNYNQLFFKHLDFRDLYLNKTSQIQKDQIKYFFKRLTKISKNLINLKKMI